MKYTPDDTFRELPSEYEGPEVYFTAYDGRVGSPNVSGRNCRASTTAYIGQVPADMAEDPSHADKWVVLFKADDHALAERWGEWAMLGPFDCERSAHNFLHVSRLSGVTAEEYHVLAHQP